MAVVKTYRVTHDGMRVGNEVRNFGDFMPEASTFPNLRAYLNAGYLEEIHVEEEAIEEWRKEFDERNAVVEDDEDEEVEEEVVDPDPDLEPDSSSTTESKKAVVAPKKSVKKAKKKRPVKKTVVKPESETEGTENVLAEQDV